MDQADLPPEKKESTTVKKSEKPYDCVSCKKSFKYISMLEDHMKTHTSEKPYECHVCNELFSQMNDLKRHIKVHKGKEPYECDVCKESFRTRSILKSHIRIHTGEKPYECHVCNKSFSQESNLKRHIRVHTGETPYECQVCSKSFTQVGSLRSHMRIHTGERPYECKVCKKSYNTLHGLKSHRISHTSEKPYECNACKRIFKYRSNWRKHMRSHTIDKSQKSRDLLLIFSDSQKRNEDTQYVCEDDIAISCTNKQVLNGSDKGNYSQHKVESHGDIEVYVDGSNPDDGSGSQVKNNQIHVSEGGYSLMSSIVDNYDNDSRNLQFNLDGSLEDISMKEEIDIHEVPIEDQSNEEFNDYCFSFKTEADHDDL